MFQSFPSDLRGVLGTLLVSLCAATPVLRAETAPEPAVSAEFLKRSAEWLVSPDAAKRKTAYRSWLSLDKAVMPAYRTALEAANRTHEKRLDELCAGRMQANPYSAHAELAQQLDDERTRVMELIKTDWKKDSSKVKMLRKEMENLAKLCKRVDRLATADTRRFDAAADTIASAMAEVARELARFETEGASRVSDDDDEEELKLRIQREHPRGNTLLTQRKRMEDTRRAVAALAAAERANADAPRWATAAMKSFATRINRERVVAGLPPFLLEEKLSDAAKGHSGDMARLGFFAHESPVPGKKTPWDRAKLAGFAGQASGENIFMGSASPDAAYDAWFASDGHRFIMFGGGSVLGVGISGVHWTMMTGNM